MEAHRRTVALALALFTARLLAQAPDCSYTLQRTPVGAILLARNGIVLQDSDYVRSGTGLRTITLNGWTDQDKITYFYTAGQTLTSGTSQVTVYLPNKEARVCTGTQNPPALPFKIGQVCTTADPSPVLFSQLPDSSCLPIGVIIPDAQAPLASLYLPLKDYMQGTVKSDDVGPGDTRGWLVLNGYTGYPPSGYHATGRVPILFR